jgi:hypothetical protein
VKVSLNKISFPPIPPNFGGNENLGFGGNREECVFHLLGILGECKGEPRF